jgi:hypothetical protein
MRIYFLLYSKRSPMGEGLLYSKSSGGLTGADPGYQVRGAHLKKLSRAEGGAKIVGVFRVKNHDFTPKNHIFSNFRGVRIFNMQFNMIHHNIHIVSTSEWCRKQNIVNHILCTYFNLTCN